MTNQNFIDKRGGLLILFVAFLFFGCTPSPVALRESKMAVPPASLTGDVERGRALFMGYQHLENDGPACMGCHSVGENGLLGGGALGPDLTNVTAQRSAAELTATLGGAATTLSPVMQPIYAEDPLTPTEQADLIAFMSASVGQPESDYELLLLGISIAGFFGVVVAIQLIYRKRLRGVRKPLVEKANSRKR